MLLSRFLRNYVIWLLFVINSNNFSIKYPVENPEFELDIFGAFIVNCNGTNLVVSLSTRVYDVFTRDSDDNKEFFILFNNQHNDIYEFFVNYKQNEHYFTLILLIAHFHISNHTITNFKPSNDFIFFPLRILPFYKLFH
ncbi:hypothetical protein HZS_462 [Henneguya salminicola]|nr:hypothetical protein HZS_462 [Henneguya salminicola]